MVDLARIPGAAQGARTKVVLLGTGNPNPDPFHQGPAVLIMVDAIPYLVDFGPGVVRQAAALTSCYGGPLEELHIAELKTAFLTHLHSDHTAGYPDLILTPWVMGRDEPLEVYGPPGLVAMTDHLLAAYRADIDYRLAGLEPAQDLGWQVRPHEISAGLFYDDGLLRVEAFPVSHGTWPNAFGFRFVTPDRTIVISGDTAPCANLREFARGADLLLHEVYFAEGFGRRDQVWQTYHRTHHTSTTELADLAGATRPGLLVLYHTLFWGGSEAEILEEIARHYNGPVVVGRDLQVL